MIVRRGFDQRCWREDREGEDIPPTTARWSLWVAKKTLNASPLDFNLFSCVV